jgi:hypothetical protein
VIHEQLRKSYSKVTEPNFAELLGSLTACIYKGVNSTSLITPSPAFFLINHEWKGIIYHPDQLAEYFVLVCLLEAFAL